MSRKLLSALSTVLILVFANVQKNAVADTVGVSTFIEFANLKAEIERAIAEARLIEPQSPFFIIQQIDLKLRGARVGEGGAKFSIPVWLFSVDLGATGRVDNEEIFEISLIPPETGIVGGTKLVDLTPLITMLKKAFEEDRQGGLLAKKIKYTRKWALQRKVEGEVDAVVLKVGAHISDEKAQQITFHICQTIDLKTCVGTAN